jgi:hypothetical protein
LSLAILARAECNLHQWGKRGASICYMPLCGSLLSCKHKARCITPLIYVDLYLYY